MPDLVTEPGFYDVSEEDYHADNQTPSPSLSAGCAWTLITGTPRHAWTASQRLNPNFVREDSEAFDIGRAAHALLTGVGGLIKVVEAPDWRTNAAKAERDAAHAAGQTPMLRKHAEAVYEFVMQAREQLAVSGHGNPFERGKCEQSGFWQTGKIWNRMRVDVMDYDYRVAWDYKTTAGKADPDTWYRGPGLTHGINLRVAFYLEGIAALCGPDWRYRLIVQEKQPPYALSILELPTPAIDLGNDQVRKARDLWATCLAQNTWPGWPAGVVVPDMPPWIEERWVDKRDERSALVRRSGGEAEALGEYINW